MGYCGKLFGVRGSVLLAEREGGNKKGSVLKNTCEHLKGFELTKTNAAYLTMYLDKVCSLFSWIGCEETNT